MTQTATIRLTEPTVGGDTGLWGGELNNNMIYIDEAVNQSVIVNIVDTNVTLVHDGSSSDQARYLRYNFTGALTANRTVTLPSNVKVGWASNNTSGGHNLILTTGSGSTLTLTTGGWTLFQCDGTNVTAPAVAIGGTTTNDNAVSGTVGEFVSSTLGSGSATALTNSTSKDVTSISLTAGDWDVWGTVGFTSVSIAMSEIQTWINTVSATPPADTGNGGRQILLANSGIWISGCQLAAGTVRLSLASTTTVYLSTFAIFSGTCSAYGFIGARRRR